MTSVDEDFANPFDHSGVPDEPPRGAVIAYQYEGVSGVTLDYVSFRAGDGLWYTTGRTTRQGVKWGDLFALVSGRALGPIKYATAWATLTVPQRGETETT